MNLHAWIAIATTLGVFLALQLRRGAATDLLFLGGLVFVTLCGVITPQEALSGFASNALLTIAGLLVCSAALRSTGLLDWLGHQLLGAISSERAALSRLAAALVSASAFVLNTAVVAMMMPVVLDWCRKRNVAPSRMLLPVSYLTILGGVCTLIGTSTTLVLNQGLQTEYAQRTEQLERSLRDVQTDSGGAEKHRQFVLDVRPMRLFEIGQVGLPCALVGSLVLLVTAPWVLPGRREVGEEFGTQRREYLVEMLVRPECRLIGQTVEAAGLRQLPGLFLIEIDRPHEIVTPVTPHDAIYAGDRLVFSGIVGTIVDLEKIPGLLPAADSAYELDPQKRQGRTLTEVVLSRTCPLIGTTVREGSFRERYNAAIVAVHRNGVRLTNKIGDIMLEPGDTLLLQTQGDFTSIYRDSRDFYLVSDVAGSTPRRHEKAGIAAVLALVLILWLCGTSFFRSYGLWPGFTSTAMAAIAVAGLMVVTRCLTISDARSAIDLPLLMTIAGALGLATALEKSGAAAFLARGLVTVVGDHPMLLLVVLYVLTLLFTEMITNNAVAATLLPLAINVAWEAGYSPRPFIMVIALGASLSFLTPIGYQTNLMVMGPGSYRPFDYFRAGWPLALSVAVTALLLIPRVWPFAL